MSGRIVKTVLCAALLVMALGSTARGAFFSPHFDPQFDGNVLFEIGDACLGQADATYPSFGSCQIDLISANLSDLTNPLSSPYTSGTQSNIGILVTILANEVDQFSTQSITLQCGIECSGQLQFFIGSCDGDVCLAPSATLTNANGDTLTDGYQVVSVASPVPEAGSFALLIAGLSALWLMRRRKAAGRAFAST